MANAKFARYAWIVLAYTIPVILFGAFVRAGLHGDGCGAFWPGCNGALIASGTDLSESIEFGHRVSSAVLLPLVLGLLFWAIRAFPRGHSARKAAGFVLLFTLTEGALGAGLVKFQWVAHDESLARVFAMAFHLINTFFLLGAQVLTAHFGAGGEGIRIKGQGSTGWAIMLGLGALLLLGVTGAITALGDTIFPVKSAFESLSQDLAPTSHVAERFRLLHPLIATSVGLFLLFACGLVSKNRPVGKARKYARWVVAGFILQMVLGIANVALQAPIWMQIIHLAVSDGIWIAMVLFGASALAQRFAQPVERREEAVAPQPQGLATMVKAYLALTKPRVVSLLLFTTVAAMFIAQRGWPGGWLVVFVSIGGYMAAGAANAFNMIVEQDLDLAMERTANRPTVQKVISTRNALIFGFAMMAGSFAILWAAANLLAAMMALCGLLFYFFIYTLALKRRTHYNIVIGGAAGAFPPLVGYAAVTGYLDPLAWYLFAIICLWTPVHFWALALLIKDDYAKAGVPMLPVVKGDRVTVIQIAVYTVLTAVITVMPLFQGHVGWVYLIGAGVLNLGLIAQSLQLLRYTDRPHARSLFKYSMVYLAALFVMFAVDRVVLLS
ncbi:MAG: protoheme IX farnesyltransferase [Armatimonadetes bacterium]|nr:protoheme IX farnesyltransferase [Armatimonadota bacterium]